jgi:hypothetical protein
MDTGAEGLAGLGLAIVASVVLGIAVLLLVYKMIDGELPAAAGLGTVIAIFFLLYQCVHPIHPVMPAVVLVVALCCMATFPYAADQLEKSELRQLHTEKLIRTYDAFVARPDNFSALFEIARGLYKHGMKANAIAITTATLNGLNTQLDPIHNRSVRDQFREEEFTLKRWVREAQANPKGELPVICACGVKNPPEKIVCHSCGRPYVIDAAHNMNLRPRILARLVLAFGLVAALIVGAAAIGLYFSGIVLVIAMTIAVGGTALAIHLLFRNRMEV